jgi:predicted ArsR family transcriptional regulator
VDGEESDAGPSETRRDPYRVLAVASRAMVLEQVRRHPTGVDTATLAREAGLHPNTVRYHLDVLLEAGIVKVSSESGGRPGRPRLRYHSVHVSPPKPPDTPPSPSPTPLPDPPPFSDRPQPTSRDGYEMLAGVLAEQLTRISADPGAAAEAAGRAWATRDGHGEQATGGNPVWEVTALLDELGFAPETIRDSEGWRVLLHSCPFHNLAAEQPGIVCRLHLGLLQGAVDRLGHHGETVRLQPFVAPGLCAAFVPLTALHRPDLSS